MRWVRYWIGRLLSRFRRTDIFYFWDGARWRGADPLAALRLLSAHPTFSIDTDPQLAISPLPELASDANAAMGRTVAAAREAFGLSVWDGRRGTTEAEAISLLDAFGGYLELQKKSGNPPPTWPESTASASSPAESGAVVESVCGST